MALARTMQYSESSNSLQEACRINPDDEDALKAIDLLYDAALVSSGFTVSTFSILVALGNHDLIVGTVDEITSLKFSHGSNRSGRLLYLVLHVASFNSITFDCCLTSSLIDAA